MISTVDDLVLDFYERLFTSIFSDPFKEIISDETPRPKGYRSAYRRQAFILEWGQGNAHQDSDRRKRNKVIRQVEDAADAASKSLTRFFEGDGNDS